MIRTDIYEKDMYGENVAVECANYGGVAQAMKDYGKNKVHIQHVEFGKVLFESDHTLAEIEKLAETDKVSAKDYLRQIELEDEEEEEVL